MDAFNKFDNGTKDRIIFKAAIFTDHHGRRRAERVLGDMLLRKVVQDILKTIDNENEDMVIIRKGKPNVRGIDFVHLSLAHTDGFICASASFRPIGIDCERIRYFSRGLIAKFTDDDEIRRMGRRSDALLTRIWCSKEAVSKVLGLGLRLNLHDIELNRKGRGWYANVNRPVMQFALKFKSRDNITIAIAHAMDEKEAG
jgi:phosphopantetheinyl transferase